MGLDRLFIHSVDLLIQLLAPSYPCSFLPYVYHDNLSNIPSNPNNPNIKSFCLMYAQHYHMRMRVRMRVALEL